MNNNNRGNNSNNRRRGRGNNRPQGGGRGEQLNRIDSRARGNAPQLLEKYRKLAQDAHLNGDRVTAEYYLQFADHYFRVIADTRQRQDEQRQRRDDRLPDDDIDEMDYNGDSDFPTFDSPVMSRREEPAVSRRDEPGVSRREDRRPAREDSGEAVGSVASEGETDGEPRPNPFVRENRAGRGLRGERRERGERAERVERSNGTEQGEPQTPEEQHGFDQDVRPPVIEGGRGSEGEAVEPAAVEQAPVPAPRRRGRRPRTTGDDTAGGPLEAVNG